MEFDDFDESSFASAPFEANIFLKPAPNLAARSRPEEEEGRPVCLAFGLSLARLEAEEAVFRSGGLLVSTIPSLDASLRPIPSLPFRLVGLAGI